MEKTQVSEVCADGNKSVDPEKNLSIGGIGGFG